MRGLGLKSPELGYLKLDTAPVSAFHKPLGFAGEIPLSRPNSGVANSGPRADLKGVRVLVVEDNRHLVIALKSFLEVEGIEVIGPAAATADAQRLAAEQKPDLAVVDIHLKQETAYVLIHQLEEQGIRVVVITGYAALPMLKTKVVAILQKPFNGEELRPGPAGATCFVPSTVNAPRNFAGPVNS